MKRLPETEYLRQCFDYNTITGDLTWKKRPRDHFRSDAQCKHWNRYFSGHIIDCKDTHGYLRVRINGEHFSAHRVIWKLFHGFEPSIIDHIDGDRLNNAISNLRSVSITENARNASKSVVNTSGVVGVSWHERDNRWRAFIRVNRKQVHLGNFKSKDEAVAARKAAEALYGFHENHGRVVA